MASVGQQIPYPATIQQMDKQYVEFAGTAHAPSPYVVQSQEAVVLAASGDIVSFSRPQGAQAASKGLRITYTAQQPTQPWAFEEMRIHFKNHRPFLHLLSVDRAITVCSPSPPTAPAVRPGSPKTGKKSSSVLVSRGRAPHNRLRPLTAPLPLRYYRVPAVDAWVWARVWLCVDGSE